MGSRVLFRFQLFVFWIYLQFFYFFCWVSHLILYPYLKWYKRIKFPYNFVHLHMFRIVLAVKLKYLAPERREALSKRSCIVLANHRSWADFFICCLTTSPTRCGYISRAAVGLLLPLVFLWEGFVTRNAVIFKRGKRDKDTLGKLFSKVAAFLRRGGLLLAFPEGHRHLGRGTLPLKRGLIKWAFKNQQACAVVLHYGNDLVINERTMSLNRGIEVVCDHRGIFDPADFSSAAEFYDRISHEFEQGYKELEDLCEKKTVSSAQKILTGTDTCA